MAALRFARGRVLIPSHSLAGLGRSADQTPAFTAFVTALSARAATAAPKARFRRGGFHLHESFLWAGVLLAVGVLALLVFALTTGSAALGLALAARLAFVLILMLAVLPWLKRDGGVFDPLNIPA